MMLHDQPVRIGNASAHEHHLHASPQLELADNQGAKLQLHPMWVGRLSKCIKQDDVSSAITRWRLPVL